MREKFYIFNSNRMPRRGYRFVEIDKKANLPRPGATLRELGRSPIGGAQPYILCYFYKAVIRQLAGQYATVRQFTIDIRIFEEKN